MGTSEARLDQLCKECTNTIKGFLDDADEAKKSYNKAVLEIKRMHLKITPDKVRAYFNAMKEALNASGHPLPETLRIQVEEVC